MAEHSVVTNERWIAVRKELLAKEKELTRLRDEVSAGRRELPWVRVETEYVFETKTGKRSLRDLFDGRSQLIVYHFMFGPDWSEGCPSCSMCADHYDPAIVHLNQRDVTMIAVSRAPLYKLDEFKKRMGWSFEWVSSLGTRFNEDYGVSFSEQEVEQKTGQYNYRVGASLPGTEAPGLSVFRKDADGSVFHTYSTYGRGLDPLLGVYNLLDLVPAGRDEGELPFTMAWVRHHDRYSE